MPDEDQLSLRQADQIRGDLYGLQDDLDFIKLQLARLPTRHEVWRAAMARCCRSSGERAASSSAAAKFTGEADSPAEGKIRFLVRESAFNFCGNSELFSSKARRLMISSVIVGSLV